ncbi:hypothetical protein [Castellaniella ginsengisoli]|uniref:HTH cro/C1-type domain-containing protein n=1 Tax=Castellaniella ginsengisoli TaxID=546114 RepID=A0AB39CMP0_9BURK
MQSLMSRPALLAPFQAAITHIITTMAGGKISAFAKRVGIAKSTVHCWVHGKTACTLEAALQVSAATGLPLARLAMGDFEGWAPPLRPSQLDLDLELGTRQPKVAPKFQDWVAVRKKLLEFAQLPEPISLTEAAQRLGVHRSHIYSQANREARIVSARWKTHMKAQVEENRKRIRQRIEMACLELSREGRALNLRELQTKIPKEELDMASHLFEMLREIRESLVGRS